MRFSFTIHILQNKKPAPTLRWNRVFVGGRERDRTDDPHNAIVVLYQLSYAPTILSNESGSVSIAIGFGHLQAGGQPL